ncbi:hypothetical protein MTR_1g107310 [Medicago truncatula]|uniref:Uncharacterized protein n=1 Tax=Medicago truncatula TaxID=3880 RepID=A0A072VQJ9_MEDTR|nr:hypothetical protein MTR_1g107310 [Medicago truncatula]
MYGINQGNKNRTGRSNRLNREPDLSPVRKRIKTALLQNREQTAKPEENRKTGGFAVQQVMLINAFRIISVSGALIKESNVV